MLRFNNSCKNLVPSSEANSRVVTQGRPVIKFFPPNPIKPKNQEALQNALTEFFKNVPAPQGGRNWAFVDYLDIYTIEGREKKNKFITEQKEEDIVAATF